MVSPGRRRRRDVAIRRRRRRWPVTSRSGGGGGGGGRRRRGRGAQLGQRLLGQVALLAIARAVVGDLLERRHRALVAERAQPLDRDLADHVEGLGVGQLDQRGHGALVAAGRELLGGVAALLLPRRAVDAGGLLVDELDPARHVRPAGPARARRRRPPARRRARTSGGASLISVREAGRPLPRVRRARREQLVAGRGRDARHHQRRAIGGHAPRGRSRSDPSRDRSRHRRRPAAAALDQPPARAGRRGRAVVAAGQRAARRARAARAVGAFGAITGGGPEDQRHAKEQTSHWAA
jgi:hypothetical protein